MCSVWCVCVRQFQCNLGSMCLFRLNLVVAIDALPFPFNCCCQTMDFGAFSYWKIEYNELSNGKRMFEFVVGVGVASQNPYRFMRI